MDNENIAKIYRHANRAISAKMINDPQQFKHEWKMFKRLTPEIVLKLIKDAGYKFIDEELKINENSYILYTDKIEN